MLITSCADVLQSAQFLSMDDGQPAVFFHLQCIKLDLVCNGLPECVDESDEVCQVFDRRQQTYPPPKAFFFQGLNENKYPMYSPMENATACPKTHFRCPGHGYCLPVFVRCNGVNDCPGREDEVGCESYTCPGFYRCRDCRVCLHAEHVCDTQIQCPHHDDEVFCEVSCPSMCTCFGWSFVCSDPFLAFLYQELRYVDAGKSRMTLRAMADNAMLIHLSLAGCELTSLDNVKTLPNLRTLDLNDNLLHVVRANDLRFYPNLQVLILSRNPITSLVESGSFIKHHLNLKVLDVSHVIIKRLDPEWLSFAPNLRTLNFSDCGIQHIVEKGFQSLKQLSHLDLRGCPLNEFSSELFAGLYQLTTVLSDNYRICCASVLLRSVDADKCQALPNAVSTCEDLIG